MKIVLAAVGRPPGAGGVGPNSTTEDVPVAVAMCPTPVSPHNSSRPHRNRPSDTPPKHRAQKLSTTAAGHYDIYVGDAFARNVTDQLDFLSRHVPVEA